MEVFLGCLVGVIFGACDAGKRKKEMVLRMVPAWWRLMGLLLWLLEQR